MQFSMRPYFSRIFPFTFLDFVLLDFQIVFLTALFYLLSSSGSQYKVVEWISGVSMGTRFSESVNIAVTDVFGATLKMATFYGFYTWMTHSIFGLNIVFIPSGNCFYVLPVIFVPWKSFSMLSQHD